MYRLISLLVALVLVPAAALAGAPEVVKVQGLYEGTRSDSSGSHKFEARVVALGQGQYKVLIREAGKKGAVTKTELAGKTDGDKVTFTGKWADGDVSASYNDGSITGTCGKDGKVQMKRVVRLSPTMGAKPPAGAIVLLDGKHFDEVYAKPGKDGKVPKWTVAPDGGVMMVKGGIHSKRTFAGSFKLHVEFKNPLMPDARSQRRGNSGCFMPNGNEVQVLDSFGMTTYKGGCCGGLYRFKDPDAFDEYNLASAPPAQWQTYDITYIVPAKEGNRAARPVITVLQNGIEIQKNVRLNRPPRAGQFMFQDHNHDPVQYRNIWVLPIK